MKYKTLSIKNSQTGLGDIKAIICDAYSIGDENSINRFRTLVELAKNQSLCDRLDKLSPVTETITFNSGREQETLTFETLRQKLVLITKGKPSIELYLMCSDLTNDAHKKIKVRFEERMNTFNGHLGYILETQKGNSLIDAIKRFYNDADIGFLIEYVLNRKSSGGAEEFNHEHVEGFNKIITAISELEKRYNRLRSETLNTEIRGK